MKKMKNISVRSKYLIGSLITLVIFVLIVYFGIYSILKNILGEKIMITLLLLIFGIILIFIFDRLIVRNIVISSKNFLDTSINQGDLTRRLPVVSKDELGQISRKFNIQIAQIHNIVYKLKNIVKYSSNISNDLISSSDEISSAVEESNATINSIFKNSETLNNNIILTRKEFDEIIVSLKEIVKQIEDQVVSVEQSSAAIEELISSINNLNRITESKVKQIDNLVGLASESESSMRETLDSIHDVSNSVETIQDLIKVINNIVDQTDILSMNAAIEAAHAGEFGKGFSVVANEIKKLAENTSENIEVIATNLKNIIHGVKISYELTQKTDSSINKMVGEIYDVKNSFSEIGAGMKEMSLGTNEISTALSKLVDITEDIKGFSKNIFQRFEKVDISMTDVTKISSQNTSSFQEILSAINEITKLGLLLTKLGKENSEYIDIINDNVKIFKIIDPSDLKTVEGLPLLMWNIKQKKIPAKRDDPSKFPEDDERHWYDIEYRGWYVEKENIPESKGEGSEGKKICCLIAGEHPYYDAYKTGMNKIAARYGIQINYAIGNWTPESEVKNINDAIKKKPDLIIMSPLDPNKLPPYLIQMNSAGLPVIISTAMPTSEGFKYIIGYTGFDDWGSHRLLAREFAKDLNHEGDYCIIRHASTTAQFTDRTYPVLTELKKIAPKMKCLEMKSTELNKEATKQLVLEWMKKYSSTLKGLVISDSFNPLIGAVEALDQLKRNDIIIYVTGNNQVSLDYMKQGKVHGIRWESAEGDGALAVEMAIDWFNGLEITPIKYLPAYVIKRDEVDKYYPPQW